MQGKLCRERRGKGAPPAAAAEAALVERGSVRARRRQRREGGVAGVWRRWRESFLPLHFRSAFCSERERERDTHRILPPPPPRPSLPLPPRSVPTHRAQAAPPRPPALALSEGAAAAVAAAPWQRCPSATLLSPRLGARLGTGSARRGPTRVDVVKQARGEGICLGRTPPGSTCSLHWGGDGRGASPPPGPDYCCYIISPPPSAPRRRRRPSGGGGSSEEGGGRISLPLSRILVGFRRRFAQVIPPPCLPFPSLPSPAAGRASQPSGPALPELRGLAVIRGRGE